MKQFMFWLMGTAILFSTWAVFVIAEDNKPVPLFDGHTLKGWHGYKSTDISKIWSVESVSPRDSAIFCNGHKGGDLVTDKKYSNFELRFEWKISPDGDSGVVYRIDEDEEEAIRSGPEFQILDDKNKEPESPTTSSASLYSLYGSEKKELKPAGEFNQSRIVVMDDHIQHWLNEGKVVDCHIGSEDWNKKVAASKFSGWKNFAKHSSGHIALQNAGSSVWFRNITIKELFPEEKANPEKNE